MFRRGHRTTIRRRIGLAVLIAALAGPALADDAPAKPAESGFVGWFRDVGRAIGLAFRDIGLEGKRIGLAIGHGAANVGKEIGTAAKEGGKAFGRAVTGKEAADGAKGGPSGGDAGRESSDGKKDSGGNETPMPTPPSRDT